MAFDSVSFVNGMACAGKPALIRQAVREDIPACAALIRESFATVAEEFGLTYTLDHCTEGFMIPDLLRQAMTRGCRGVIAGPLIGYNGKREVRNSLRLDYPRRLWELNIPFAICTDYYENPVELLRTIATLSAAEGLPEDVALAAITSDAARIAGLGDRVGRLIPGLDADVAVFSGPPISIHSKCLMTVVNGSIVYEKRG